MSAKYNVQADAALDVLYSDRGATTVQHKIRVQLDQIEGEPNFHGCGGPVTDEMKLAMLETEYLAARRLIELSLH